MELILKQVFDDLAFLNELSASLLGIYHIWFTTVLVILIYRCCESAVTKEPWEDTKGGIQFGLYRQGTCDLMGRNR